MAAIAELTLDEVRLVYRTYIVRDFPRSERKPLSRIEAGLRRGEYRCLGMKDGGEVLAYAFLVTLNRDGKRLCLFEYLAVRQELRGQGIGSLFLDELGKTLAVQQDCVLLEVEDPDAAPDEAERQVRTRRLHFYLKNGLRDTGARSLVFGVHYSILEIPTAAAHSALETREIYQALYRSFLPALVFAARVKMTGRAE